MSVSDGLDNPGSDPAEDKFNRWSFSKQLAKTIAAFDTRNGAPVFGIFGRWGYGKSTVLNYIKQELTTTHADKVVLFEFNPWLFANQEELLAAFFAGLAASFEKSLSSPVKDAAKLLQKYSGLFGMIPVVGSGASKLADQLGKELSANSLDIQRRRVFEIVRNAPRVVVVLIDDLDRLDSEEILIMLKLVRLNANFPRVVYVLAFDDEMVAKVAGAKYGGGPDIGRQFLEKIVHAAKGILS
jgi:predicted KAP-like P-loop ATPase